MLATYAQAVAKMQSTSPNDPRSWVFQWYAHAVGGNTTKDTELSRIFGGNQSPAASLASEVWNTCKSHFGEDENFFLPWHRMYVYFFERIIRSVSGNTSFTLPYWNYSIADATAHGVIPIQFRSQGDATFGSLFVGNRNPGVDDGQPIDANDPGALDLTVLGEGSYGPNGAQGGFCQDLDFGLHGAVHVDVGTTTNMGQIPYAANDPIFWMHHCNIDRLWTSWNKNGGQNPGGSWLTQQFIFADENGNRVAATIQDFVDTGKLGYSYDSLEPAPQGFVPIGPSLIGHKPSSVVAKVAGGLKLGAAAATARLESAHPGVTFKFPTQVAALLPEKKLYLVLRGLSTDTQPGVLYNVYVNLPAGTTPKKGDPHYAGVINFFGAQHMHAAGSGSPSPASDMSSRFRSLDITQVVRKLSTQGALNETPSVSLVPVGKPLEAAKPVVGEITLVEQ